MIARASVTWLFFGLLAARLSAEVPTNEGVIFDSDVIDLGIVGPGSNTAAVCYVRNTTSEVVEIAKIEPTCACTVVKASRPTKLQPGERCKVEFTVSTRTTGGPFTTSAEFRFRSVSGNESSKTIRFRCDVESPGGVVVIPSSLELGTLHAGAVFQRELKVEKDVLSSEGLGVESISVPSWAAYELQRNTDRTWRLRVTGRVPKMTGALSDEIVITTTHRTIPKRRVPVTGIIRGTVSAEPKAVVRIAENESVVEAIASLHGSGITIKRCYAVDITGGSVNVSDKTTADGILQFGVAASIDVTARACRGAVMIEVVTTSKESEMVRVPFVFIRRPNNRTQE